MRLLSIALILAMVSAGCLSEIRETIDPIQPADYIRDDDYTKWVIEVDYVSGMKPDQAWLNELDDKMTELVRKDQVTVKLGNVVPGKDVWSDSDIRALPSAHQDEKTGGDTVVTHVTYLDGRYTNNDVLGITYNYDQVVIFKERIDSGCTITNGCVGNANTVQRAVLIHEFGHALGLVARGVPMVNPHEGTGPGAKHSNNENSVMYYAVESAGVFGLSRIPTTFDSNDKLDICAFGGKGSC